MQKKYMYFLSILMVTIAMIAEGNAQNQQSYVAPLLLRTITFGEQAEQVEDPDPCMAKKKRDVGELEKVGISIREKVYDLLQHGIPLTEDEKLQAMDAYSFFYPASARPQVYKVLSGNLHGLPTMGLSSISWLTGVDMNILVATRDASETVEHMRHDRSLRDASLQDGAFVDGYYGNGNETSWSDSGTRALEPIGLFFRSGTAEKSNSINFNGDDKQDGGINAYIKYSEKNSFGFAVDVGFKGAFKFQMSTDQSAFITIRVYGDYGCSSLLATKNFAIDLETQSFNPNDAAIVSIEFNGLAHCVTIFNRNDDDLTLQMDNFGFGTPYAGSILFNEPPLHANHALDRNSDASTIQAYYGEGTSDGGTWSADRLGVYLDFDPSSSFYSQPGQIFITSPATYGYSVRVQIYRGFYNNFSILVASHTDDFPVIQFNLYSGATCEQSVASRTWSFPAGATAHTVYTASVSVQSSATYTCVEFASNGDATVTALMFGSPVPVPTVKVCPTGFSGANCNQCANGYTNFPKCYATLSPALNYIFNKAAFNNGQFRVVSSNNTASTVLNDVSASSINVFQFNGLQITGDGTSSGLCLDVSRRSFRAGTAVLFFKCNGQRNQQWTYSAGNGWAAIHPNGYSSLCLATSQAKTDVGTALTLQNCNGQDYQLWSRTSDSPPAVPTTINIAMSGDSSFSDSIANGLANQFRVSSQDIQVAVDSVQAFTASFIANVAIVDQSSGIQQEIQQVVADITSDVAVDSVSVTRVAPLISSALNYIFNKAAYDARTYSVFDSTTNFVSSLQSPTAANTQVWSFTGTSIKTQAGLCLDVHQNKIKVGAVVGVHRCHRGVNQKWTYNIAEQWAIISPASQPSLCLAPSSSSQADSWGASVKIQTCNGSDEQKWLRSPDAPPLPVLV